MSLTQEKVENSIKVCWNNKGWLSSCSNRGNWRFTPQVKSLSPTIKWWYITLSKGTGCGIYTLKVHTWLSAHKPSPLRKGPRYFCTLRVTEQLHTVSISTVHIWECDYQEKAIIIFFFVCKYVLSPFKYGVALFFLGEGKTRK